MKQSTNRLFFCVIKRVTIFAALISNVWSHFLEDFFAYPFSLVSPNTEAFRQSKWHVFFGSISFQSRRFFSVDISTRSVVFIFDESTKFQSTR